MQAFRMFIINITSVMVIFWLVGCETTGPSKAIDDKSTKIQTATEEIGRLLTKEISRISGPKRTIAVGEFDAIGSFTSQYGDWDIGGGLASMLTTALVESNRFIVSERANINQILSEQELKAQGVANAETGPALGKLTGVQFLIYGTVTEFGTDDKGGGFSLGGGMGHGGFSNMFGGAVSRQSASGAVAMDIRIVDTTTGVVIDTYRVKEKIKSSGWDVSGGYQGMSLGSNRFNKTPLGETSRKVITKIVSFIANNAEKTLWTGRIVDIDGQEVIYINAGANSGIHVGEKFMIERVTKTFTDPQTGEILSTRKKIVGSLQIKAVEEKLSYGAYASEGLEAPKRGDLVVKVK